MRGASPPGSPPHAAQRCRMDTLLQNTVVWDNHACLPLRPADERFLPELERFRKSGVTVDAGVYGYLYPGASSLN